MAMPAAKKADPKPVRVKGKPAEAKSAAKPAAKPVLEFTLSTMDVFLSKIDATIARSVRHRPEDDGGRIAEHVERLKEAYEEGKSIPPVKVYTWPKATTPSLLGDGANRVDAAGEAGRDRIAAEVHFCVDEATARRLALRCAASANTDHGLPRSPADKRAAVRTVLMEPEYAEESDTGAGRIASVGHVLVRLVREELSANGSIPADSPAHASTRGYDPHAKLRMNLVSDGKGGLKKPDEPNATGPVARPKELSADPSRRPRATLDVSWSLVPVGRLDLPDTLLGVLEAARVLTVGTLATNLNEGESYGLTDDEFAGLCEMLSDLKPIDKYPEPVARPDAPSSKTQAAPKPILEIDTAVRDARGRLVPEPIASVFADGPGWFAARTRAVQSVLTDMEAAKGRDYAAALPAVMQVVQQHVRDVKESIRQAEPYVVCPHLDEDGAHIQGGKCLVCKGRNWLTHAVYEQLTPELKRCCEPDAKPK